MMTAEIIAWETSYVDEGVIPAKSSIRGPCIDGLRLGTNPEIPLTAIAVLNHPI
jgi:hypothetical protein